MPREYPRNLRVAAELQRTLNDLLRNEIKDPRLEGVTVSAVELSRDISVARVFFSTLKPDADPQPAISALSRAGGFLRSRAGQMLRMRRVPELRFSQDRAPQQGLALTRLIEEAASKGNGEADQPDDADLSQEPER